MTTTERAAQELKNNMIQRCFDAGLGFRVINNIDESGQTIFSIKLDQECPDDEVVVSHGIKILLDPTNAAQLGDCELDYVDIPAYGFCLKSEKVVATAKAEGMRNK